MNTRRRRIVAISVLVLSIVLAIEATGCRGRQVRPRPRAYNLEIIPKDRADEMAINVYIGAGNSYDRELKETDVDTLLQRLPASGRTEILEFPLKGTKDISAKDRYWTTWLKVKKGEQLVVIADLPKNFGGKDSRRVSIDLDKRLWKRLQNNTIQIEVAPDAVRLASSPGR